MHIGRFLKILLCAGSPAEYAKMISQLKNWDLKKVYYPQLEKENTVAAVPVTTSQKLFKNVGSFVKMISDIIPKDQQPNPPNPSQIVPAANWMAIWSPYQKEKVRPSVERQCAALLKSTHKCSKFQNLEIDINYNVKCKLIYLPVYLCSYAFEGKIFRYTLQGLSGQIVAEGRPYGSGAINNLGRLATQFFSGIGSKNS